jgi:protocatechuate 3,4-dioxygenase beta subunit
MTTKWIAIALFAAFFGLAQTGAATAGTTGVINGHVFDEYGRPLQGATVQLIALRTPNESNKEVDPATHALQVRLTSSSGFFVFISVDPGVYQIRTIAQGLYFVCPPRVLVFADQSTFVDLVALDHYVEEPCEPASIFGPP